MSKANRILLPVGTKVPNHIAVIPDGNRRWARSRDLKPTIGHQMGAERVTELIRAAREWGIHTLTFWGLSTENWLERSGDEVKLLIKIICKLLVKNVEEAKREGSRIIHLGRKDRLPKVLLEKLRKAEEETRNNGNYVFNIALDYGGQDELIRAIKKIAKDKINPDRIDKELIDRYLDTRDQPYPYPDLIIRTGHSSLTLQ